MRVTGGSWGSRRLRGPSRGMPLRPTPDAMRERAFAVLGEQVVGATVLDLFAGTGAVGLEALSRGARRAVFVDRHRAAAGLIRANCTGLGLDREPDRWLVLVRPADAALRELARRHERFDLVWADPPFEQWRSGLEALARAGELGLLAADAIACLECPAEARLDPDDLATLAAHGIRPSRDLTGGASRVLLLRSSPPDDPASRHLP